MTKIEKLDGQWLSNCVVLAGASCRPDMVGTCAETLEKSDATHFEIDKETVTLLLRSVEKLCEVKDECGKKIARLENPETCSECGCEDGDENDGAYSDVENGLCKECIKDGKC